MSEVIDILVNFNDYCPNCEYAKVDGIDEPCNTCLDYPVNQYTDIPVKFKDSRESSNL